MRGGQSLVRVTVITFRRPSLLERALRSLVAQTLPDWTAEVLNDAPDDPAPGRVIETVGDPRIRLVEPPAHRGGTRNLNFAFRAADEPFGAVLEDDNWWEPEFLETMVAALIAHPAASIITANERIWVEEPDGSWTRTGTTLRPERDAVWELEASARDKCGGAILANSAVLFRTRHAQDWTTPDTIPVDVTEHYRERIVPHPVLVHDRVLVNFARTRATYRSHDPVVWDSHQVLLIASVMAVVQEGPRQDLARDLLDEARSLMPQQRTALLLAGLFIPEARVLWRMAAPVEKLRVLLHLICRWRRVARYRRLLQEHSDEWNFLRRGPVAESLSRAL